MTRGGGAGMHEAGCTSAADPRPLGTLLGLEAVTPACFACHRGRSPISEASADEATACQDLKSRGRASCTVHDCVQGCLTESDTAAATLGACTVRRVKNQWVFEIVRSQDVGTGTFSAHRALLAAAALAFFTLCEDMSRLHSGRRYAQNASATTGATLIRDLWRMRLSRHCTQRAHDCGRPLRGRVIFLPAKPRLRIPGPNPNPFLSRSKYFQSRFSWERRR